MVGRYDEGWKEVIKAFFPQFLGFFFPGVAEEIDFAKGFQFLDQELARISRKGLGRRRADLLVKVFLKDGQERWILVHVEVQRYPQEDFPRRMYVYNYRIFDRYGRDVVSLAVLTDPEPGFRPESYLVEIGEFRHELRYGMVKLLDYRERWEELETSPNPFSVVVMVHLKEQETKRKVHERLNWKLRLTRMLYDRGYTREEIWDLYRFIDWIISLPEDVEEMYHEEIFKEEEARAMPYITTAERIGMRKAQQEMVLEALEERFEEVPEDIEGKVKGIRDGNILRRLHRYAIRCKSLEEFREELAKVSG